MGAKGECREGASEQVYVRERDRARERASERENARERKGARVRERKSEEEREEGGEEGSQSTKQCSERVRIYHLNFKDSIKMSRNVCLSLFISLSLSLLEERKHVHT